MSARRLIVDRFCLIYMIFPNGSRSLRPRKITLTYLCRIADYFHEDIDFLLRKREY